MMSRWESKAKEFLAKQAKPYIQQTLQVHFTLNITKFLFFQITLLFLSFYCIFFFIVNGFESLKRNIELSGPYHRKAGLGPVQNN